MNAPTGTFTLDRSFNLTPDQLWHLLTDPAERTKWGAPSDDDVLILESHDLREGGRDRHFCGPKDNPEFAVDTLWYHLEGPTLACFTETLEAGGARLSVSLVTYDLVKTETGTDLGITVTVASVCGEDVTADHLEGWTSGIDRLMAQVTASQAA